MTGFLTWIWFVQSAEALSFVEAVSQDATRMFQKEQEREESTLPFFILSPHGKFRLRWDILSVALISCELLIRSHPMH